MSASVHRFGLRVGQDQLVVRCLGIEFSRFNSASRGACDIHPEAVIPEHEIRLGKLIEFITRVRFTVTFTVAADDHQYRRLINRRSGSRSVSSDRQREHEYQVLQERHGFLLFSVVEVPA